MVRDNTDKWIETLVRDYRAYNDAIENARMQQQSMVREKAWTVGQLRRVLSVVEICDLLDVTPQVIYSMGHGEIEDRSPDDEVRIKSRGLTAARKTLDSIAGSQGSLIGAPDLVERTTEAMSVFYAAWAGYVRALRAAGRPVPHQVSP